MQVIDAHGDSAKDGFLDTRIAPSPGKECLNDAEDILIRAPGKTDRVVRSEHDLFGTEYIQHNIEIRGVNLPRMLIPLCLSYHSRHLTANDVFEPRQVAHVKVPRAHGSRRYPRFGDVIDDESHLRASLHQLTGGPQVFGENQKFVDEPGFSECLHPGDEPGGEHEVNNRL